MTHDREARNGRKDRIPTFYPQAIAIQHSFFKTFLQREANVARTCRAMLSGHQSLVRLRMKT